MDKRKTNAVKTDQVTKTMFDRALKQITFWDNINIDKNNLPPGYSLKDYTEQLKENHRIVNEYLDNKQRN